MYCPPANSATHNPDKEIRLFEVNAGGHTKKLFSYGIFSICLVFVGVRLVSSI